MLYFFHYRLNVCLWFISYKVKSKTKEIREKNYSDKMWSRKKEYDKLIKLKQLFMLFQLFNYA